MVERLDVDKEVLFFHIKQSGIPIELIRKREKNIDLFLSGEKNPTFNQLSQLAKYLKVPTGLLLLNAKVSNEPEELKFRTLDSENLDGFSSELRDTIKEMKIKQEFLKNEIETDLDFIGSFSVTDNAILVANAIKKQLQLTDDYYDKSKKDHFTYLRKKINEMGVFVFLNGKVKDNTHRPLNLEEFRGFVLSDKRAPIIFINQTDSRNGQVFTLIHEYTHLLLNEDEIFNIVETKNYAYDPVEYFVNKVTAEVLVPEEKFVLLAKRMTESDLAIQFGVSQFVILRRLLDLGFINKEQYQSKVNQLNLELASFSKVNRQSGGNYHNTLKFRMDKPFVRYIENAVAQNSISYTDAFSILGVGYKGYKTLVGRDN